MNSALVNYFTGVLTFLRNGQIYSTHADFCGRDYTSCLRKLDGGSSSSSNGKDEGDMAADNCVIYRHNLGLQAVNCRTEFTNCTYVENDSDRHVVSV